MDCEYFAVGSISHAFTDDCRVRHFLHLKNLVTVAIISSEIMPLIREGSFASRPERRLSNAYDVPITLLLTAMLTGSSGVDPSNE